MKTKRKFKQALIIAAFLIAPTVWMTVTVLNDSKVTCKVCMDFRGQQNCGTAIGSDRESCIATAKDNACATIASGMTESIQCSQSSPKSTEVK